MRRRQGSISVRQPVAAWSALLVLGLVLAGCGGDGESENTTGNVSASQAETPTATATATPESRPSGRDEKRASQRRVSRAKAISIARKAVGGGRVTDTDRDDDDGRPAWKIKLAQAGGVSREVKVAVRGGRVLERETDRDDDNDDDDDDDNDDGDDDGD